MTRPAQTIDRAIALFGADAVESLTNGASTPSKALTPVSLPDVSGHPLMSEAAWIAHRDSGIEPLDQSELLTTEQSRREFLTGAALLGLLDSVHPQQLRVNDMLNAGRLLNGVIMPRRSSKTTTLFIILLGRCACRPDHMTGFTLATTQKKTAERFRLDIYKPMTRAYPDPDRRPFKLYKGNGSERVEFPNGSQLAALSPEGDAFRSGAYDTLLVDEGGEAAVELGAEILSAILPTLDTRPEAQLVIAGTAAKYREGNILWHSLTTPGTGRIRYTVADDVTADELAAWEPDDEHPEARVRELVETMHPGVGTLTTLDRIEFNYANLNDEQFTIEYLGLFGTIGESVGLFDLTRWADAGSGSDLPELPDRFGLAAFSHIDQTCASIVAAWRDKDGRAVPLLIDHRRGVEWIPKVLYPFARKHGATVTYDGANQTLMPSIMRLQAARPRPKLNALQFADVKRAHALIVEDVERGHVAHYRQPELDNAIRVAVKRKAGANGWAIGRDPKTPTDDTTAAEAWALAQLAYDLSTPTGSRPAPKVRA